MSNIGNVLTSMEVAQMVDKKHYDLLKDIRRYTSQLGEGKISVSDFFSESTYTTEQNKTVACYLVTKKGCEFIAHKLTGQKGTEFTARYINRFHEMEDELTIINPSDISLGELASYLKIMDRKFLKVVLDNNVATNYNNICSNKERQVIILSAMRKGTKLTENPKDYMLRVRMDKSTVDKLDTVCEKEKKSRSEVVREGIEQKYQQIKK